MTNRTAWLRATSPADWAGLATHGMTTWLWFDTTPGDAIHLSDSLPHIRPADVTHVWGWTGERLGRWRVDHALRAGTVGAVVSLTDPGEADWERVEAQQAEGRTWNPRDGRTNLDPNHPLLGQSRPVTTWTVTVTQQQSTGAIALVPLVFLRIHGSGGPA